MKIQANYPSVKKIEKALNISNDQAKKVRSLLDGTETTELISDSFGTGFHESYYIEAVLRECSDIIEGSGVEYVFTKKCTFTNFFGLSFINTGDIYNSTIIYDCKKNRFLISSIGDIIENNDFYL